MLMFYQVPLFLYTALLDSWDILDLDMDGRLDMSEFSDYFQQSSVSQSVFERLDANRDDFITKEEINMAMYLLKGEAAEGTDGSDNTAGGNAAETQSSSAPVSVSPPTGTEASAPLPDTTGSPSATDLLMGKYKVLLPHTYNNVFVIVCRYPIQLRALGH